MYGRKCSRCAELRRGQPEEQPLLVPRDAGAAQGIDADGRRDAPDEAALDAGEAGEPARHGILAEGQAEAVEQPPRRPPAVVRVLAKGPDDELLARPELAEHPAAEGTLDPGFGELRLDGGRRIESKHHSHVRIRSCRLHRCADR